MLWKNILLIGLGGGVGSIARFLCQKYIYEWYPHPFPFGTMIVNVAGCFLIGLFCALADKGNLLTPEWRLLLTTGFCGGFTTFSTFAYENLNLLKSGQVMYFILYTAASVILGLLATWFGYQLVSS
ncbi:fluoride efflux transporter CrcB [Niastella caeni]|uniref:Fluoride-specific ion channel FluC n=1 Tax=Niastella caeni TaxID=2569763 RepID=A0A4S8I334_9BACT|nr:fluoride efflux transporter CrcB [Niastella caeni]THU40412.1 fluoride efflux transporter CrcB [Niastella caeni]